MSLMTAGVPIKAPVAGISCGLVTGETDDDYLVLTDIQGLEDFFGDMDFGVKNHENGNTTYADNNDFDGMLRAEDGSLIDYHVIFSYWKKWMPLEQKFNDMSDLGSRAYQPKQEG